MCTKGTTKFVIICSIDKLYTYVFLKTYVKDLIEFLK